MARRITRAVPGARCAVVLACLAASGGAPYGETIGGSWFPDDPLFAAQWPLHNTGKGGRVVDADVDAPEAWAVTRGAADIVIAVLDDGVELEHPDLAPNIKAPGADFTRLPPGGTGAPAAVTDRHGTAVAGIAAARADNGEGIAGMCPRCTILPVRVRGSDRAATAAAFRYAVEHGADVITNSWGIARDAGAPGDADLAAAIEAAAREGRDGRGALVVFGVTNEVVDNCAGKARDIAALDAVIAVGVSDHNDRVGFSGFGACLDLVAPAKPMRARTVGVPTTDRAGLAGHAAGSYHLSFGGTSAAAPLVAGIAGLVLSLNPDLTGVEVLQILRHTADRIDADTAAYDVSGFSRVAGHGRVNAARALMPAARVRVEPSAVRAGKPFDVIVTASAPVGLVSVAWQGESSGRNSALPRRERAVGGEAFATVTWTGIVIEQPGVYSIEADARAVHGDRTAEAYPRTAAAAGAGGRANVTVRALE